MKFINIFNNSHGESELSSGKDSMDFISSDA